MPQTLCLKLFYLEMAFFVADTKICDFFLLKTEGYTFCQSERLNSTLKDICLINHILIIMFIFLKDMLQCFRLKRWHFQWPHSWLAAPKRPHSLSFQLNLICSFRNKTNRLCLYFQPSFFETLYIHGMQFGPLLSPTRRA